VPSDYFPHKTMDDINKNLEFVLDHILDHGVLFGEDFCDLCGHSFWIKYWSETFIVYVPNNLLHSARIWPRRT
jgi:hypothetical protein